MEYKLGLMEVNIKVNLNKINEMVKVSMYGQIVKIMMVIGSQITDMAMVNINGMIQTFILECFL